jgi:simple sugar transport system permease protein
VVLALWAFGVDPVSGVGLIARGALGDRFGVARTLVRAVPLVLVGLGVVVAWRAGVFNIGGEGQYVVGGLAAAWLAAASPLAGPLATVGLLVAAALGGAALAWLAGWLEVRRRVPAVITTILLNFVALQALDWAVRGPLQEPTRQRPLSARLPGESMLPRFDPQTDLHAGVFVALLAVVVVWAYFRYSHAGFRVRLVGENPRVARANRIDTGRTKELAMAFSGALCGLAGGVTFAGVSGQVGDGFAEGWGFLAIPVALLGGLEAWGVLAASVLFGALLAGSENLARFSPVGPTVVYVIQGLSVLGVLAAFRWRRAGGSGGP